MASFFTRSGDDGYTGILGEGRLPKHSLRLNALGDLDEANAALGMARFQCQSPQSKKLILRVQRHIYTIMGEVASSPENASKFKGINSAQINWLEQETEKMSQDVKMPGEFIVPGDTLPGAALDLARTVVRRCERRVAELIHREEVANQDLMRYLNRLSSLIFVLELYENQLAGQEHPTLAKDDD